MKLKFFVLALLGLTELCAESLVYQKAVAQFGVPMQGPHMKALPQANPDAPKGGTIRIAQMGTFDTIFPYPFKGIPCAGNGITDEPMVYEKLMFQQVGEPHTLYAWVAEGVAIDPENRWVEFKLNSQAKWADGKPLTTADVAFSIQALKEQGRPIFRNHLKPVRKVEIQSPQIIRIYIDPTPDPLNEGKQIYSKESLLILCRLTILPKHILEGKKFDDMAQQVVIGSGPYELTDVKMGASVTFKRRKNYWGENLPVNIGRSNFDEVKFVYFRDPQIAFEALKAGDVDFMVEEDVNRRKSGYNFDAFRSGQIVLSALSGAGAPPTRGFVMNTRQDKLKSLPLRKALTLALDYGWFQKNLYETNYRRSKSFFGNGAFADQSRQTAREARLNVKDPQKRKRLVIKLLEEAGYKMIGGQCLDMQTKKPLTFDLIIENNDSQKEAVAYARMLRKGYGIQLNIRKLDSAQFWHRVMDFDFEIVAIKWLGMSSPGTEQINRWTSESADRKGSLNWAGVCNSGVDEAVKALLAAKSLEQQTAATQAIDRLLRKGYYIVPLGYDEKRYVLHRSRLHYPKTAYAQKVLLEKSFWWDETVTKIK